MQAISQTERQTETVELLRRHLVSAANIATPSFFVISFLRELQSGATNGRYKRSGMVRAGCRGSWPILKRSIVSHSPSFAVTWGNNNIDYAFRSPFRMLSDVNCCPMTAKVLA